MTYRERRLAKAERLRGWADSREKKSEAAFGSAQTLADGIPFGQPVLVGHHSEGRARRDQTRIVSGMDKGLEHLRKAESMNSRADNIEAAAEHAIYSDDEDAIERLRERIASLEAERDQVKAYNATARKGSPDVSLLTPDQHAGLEMSERFSASYQERIKHAMPPYVLQNLGGNITRNRKRLEALERKAAA